MAIAVLQQAATTINCGHVKWEKYVAAYTTIYKVMAYIAQANLNLISATQVVAIRDIRHIQPKGLASDTHTVVEPQGRTLELLKWSSMSARRGNGQSEKLHRPEEEDWKKGACGRLAPDECAMPCHGLQGFLSVLFKGEEMR